MNYAVKQRLEMIDFLVDQYGYVTRPILMERFGIGGAAATRDIRDYKELAPDNIILEPSSKRHVKTSTFKRYFESDNAK